MFTGIVETTGVVVSAVAVAGGRRVCLDAPLVAEDAVGGASVAVNGVCLTVANIDRARLEFDVIAESLRRTNLGGLRAGDEVNLERSLRADSRLDGHLMQGHVDGTAVVVRKDVSDAEWLLWLRADDGVRRYIVPKGSVALDGISLTVAQVRGDEFCVAIIPTTLERTNLKSRNVGDSMNLESDIIARTVVHYLTGMLGESGVTIETLRRTGFL